MPEEKLFSFNIHPERGDEGRYQNPKPGIYEKVRINPPHFYQDADTASPKIEGSRTTRGLKARALVVHPEFPTTDLPQFS